MNKKHLCIGVGALVASIVFPMFILRYGDGPQFNACLAEHGASDYRLHETGVSYVTLSHASDASASQIGFDFTCVSEQTCKPRLVLQDQRRIRYDRTTPEQKKLIQAVDVCRRQGLNAFVFRRLGMLSKEAEIR